MQVPLQQYFQTEGLGGAALVLAAIVAVAWANSPWSESYDALWHLPVRVAIGSWTFSHDLRHVVNDGAMAIFFFVVGLEIKRELIEGSLSDRRRATLPVVAAIGGMVVPAALYAWIVGTGPGASGWGIPMATDIAFAMAVLGLSRAHHELKVLLLALAIVDDIGAILVIAVFYTTDFSAAAGGGALLCVAGVFLMQRAGFTNMAWYAPLAAVFWVAVLQSGVHATMAGLVLGALTPSHALVAPPTFTRKLRQLASRLSGKSGARDDETEMAVAEVEELARQSESPLDRAERLFHPWSSYAILPLFALANSGVALTADALRSAVSSAVPIGVLVGLVVGKPLGIVAFSWIAVRTAVASLPAALNWRHVTAMGFVAGIGFTVSIFISDLAFTDESLASTARVGILAASMLAAACGWAAMRVAGADSKA